MDMFHVTNPVRLTVPSTVLGVSLTRAYKDPVDKPAPFGGGVMGGAGAGGAKLPYKQRILTDREKVIRNAGDKEYFDTLALIGWLGGVLAGQDTEAMAYVDDVGAARLLLIALGDKNAIGGPTVREAAAHELGRATNPEVWKMVTDLAQSSKDPVIRQSALWALGWMGKTELNGTLIAALRDPVDAVRGQAARSLAMVGGGDTEAQALAGMVGDKSVDVRMAVAKGLGSIGGMVAVEALKGMLRDGDVDVRAAAVKALAVADMEYFLTKVVPGWQESGYQNRIAVLRGLRALLEFKDDDKAVWKSTLAQVVSMLGDKDWQSRVRAVDAAHFVVRMLTDLYTRGRMPYDAYVKAVQTVIDPLVAQFPKESGRVAGDIHDVLVDVLRVDLGVDGRAWAAWWAENRDKLGAAAAPVVASATVAQGPPKFYGRGLLDKNIVFVFDGSGSMSAKSKSGEIRLDEVLAEFKDTIKNLPDGVNVTVILLNTKNYGAGMGRTGLTLRTAQDRLKLYNEVKRMRDALPANATGRGNLVDGIDAAAQVPGVERIVVLSSGQVTAGQYALPVDVLEHIGEWNWARSIGIDVVYPGGGNAEMFEKLAEGNMGQFVDLTK